MGNTNAKFVGISSNFSISISPTTIEPGEAHTITVTRTSGSGGFQYFLLYVEDTNGDHIGTFGTLVTTQTLPSSVSECNNASTLTHVSGASFAATQAFTWTAPASINGPVTIEAFIGDTDGYHFPTALTTTTLSSALLESAKLAIEAINGQFVSSDASLTLDVYNTLGQKVANESLASGVYIVKVSNAAGEQATLKKVI